MIEICYNHQKMGKKLKTKNQKKELSQIERHFGVILEDIDSKLDLVVEGHQTLDKKIDRHYGEFQEFRKEVDYKFEIVFEKFDEVDKRFDEVTGELRVIRNELKEKVGRDEFILLEKRVAALEKFKR
jgi:tetrahydromethanopterin S-methyltransferase subunit G